MCALALFASRFWARLAEARQAARVPRSLRMLVLAATLVILGQLMLGATMRGQHAGLAIPDFPLAYGHWWPEAGPEAVAIYNSGRVQLNGGNPITAFQIELQMAHRLGALAIFILVSISAVLAWRRLGGRDPLSRLALGWLGLISCQAALGAATIWYNKAADVATAHLMIGALALVTGALWSLLARERSEPAAETVPAAVFGGSAAGAHK
jgi:heme a synthase